MAIKLDTDGILTNATGRDSAMERIERAMFDADAPPLSPRDQALREVYEGIFTCWLSHPEMSDAQMVRWVVKKYNRGERTAYRDVARAKDLIGNVRNAGREFQRYRVIQMLLESYTMAKENGDTQSMIRAAATLGRYTQLDKPDTEHIDWNRLAPPAFEPSGDVRILGIDPIEDVEAVRRELALKYGGDSPDGPTGGTPCG